MSFVMDLSLICKVHNLIRSRAVFLNLWYLTFGWVGVTFKKYEILASRMCNV